MAWDPLGTVKDAGNWLYGTGKNLLGQAGGVAEDAFTGESAQAGSYAPEDYLYGGSKTASGTAQRQVQDQGQQVAGRFAQAGQYARDTAGAATGAIYGGARDAQALGLGASATTADLSRYAQQNSANTRQFGDAGSQQNWAKIADQLGKFQYNPIDQKDKSAWTAANQNLAGYQANVRDPASAGAWDQANQNLAGYQANIGDQASRQDWATANKKLAGFGYSPSDEAKAAGDRLARFNAGQQGDQTQSTYDALRRYAQKGPGPSAAEAQMAKALDTNVAAQSALARSGRGAGANAQAVRDAKFGAAQLGQQTAADTATLRAQEAATWRGQQLGALGQAGQLGATTEAQRQSNAGLNLSGIQAQAGYAQAADQLGTQSRLAALQGAAGQYGQAAQSASQDSAQAAQLRLSALQGAAGQYGQANQIATQAGTAEAQVRLGALQGAAGQYGQSSQATDQALSQAAQLRLSGLQGSAGQWGGLSGYGVQRDVATDQSRQGWGGMALSGQNAAAGQQLGANQLYIGALGQAGQIQNQTNATQLGYLQGGTSAQAGYDQYGYGIAENEAQRRAQLQNTRMGGVTQVSQANQKEDFARDQNTMAFASKLMSFIPGVGGLF